MRIEVRCPAKVNLFLAVGPRDARGYHPLRTIFQAVSLADTLILSDDGEPGVLFSREDIPAENTVTKTLRRVREIRTLPPLRVEIAKEIPLQSGLGGGSTDAAGVLRALRRAGLGLTPEEEHAVAAEVGADVPFFLIGGRARAEGYGERLTPLPDAPPRPLVIARPEIGCATGAAYEALDRLRFPWRDFPAQDEELYNDFERVAPCASLELLERLRALGARGSLLCGSGSAVFGVFEAPEEAERAARALRREGIPFVATARTLSRAESL